MEENSIRSSNSHGQKSNNIEIALTQKLFRLIFLCSDMELNETFFFLIIAIRFNSSSNSSAFSTNIGQFRQVISFKLAIQIFVTMEQVKTSLDSL